MVDAMRGMFGMRPSLIPTVGPPGVHLAFAIEARPSPQRPTLGGSTSYDVRRRRVHGSLAWSTEADRLGAAVATVTICCGDLSLEDGARKRSVTGFTNWGIPALVH
jgi:hypothetical protein